MKILKDQNIDGPINKLDASSTIDSNVDPPTSYPFLLSTMNQQPIQPHNPNLRDNHS
jgi:hypothetical protein